MKKILLLSLLLIPAVLLASSGHGGEETRYFLQTGREHDYWQRVVNFIIFASLVYYLIASPIKNFFVGRKEGIEGQLREIEEKLQVAKDEKKEAENRLKESGEKAAQILEDAKKEAEILVAKIAESSEAELQLMEKQLEEKMAFEERKSVKEVVDQVLSENITADDITLDEEKVVEIISRKVA